MARLFGIILPDNKRTDYALTLLYGIGWSLAEKVLDQAKVDPSKRVRDLSEADLKKITALIEKTYRVEGDLREELNTNIKTLRDMGSYRGSRHMRGLPARGQRTKSNARTKRGKRKTVGALKKEVWAKMEQAQTAAPAAKK